MTKPIWQSKTVYFNVLMTVIGVATALESMPTFQAYAPYFAIILAIGNVILRVWFTTQPIATD